ncbi:helix-turn-helix domain-containing protein [Nocardiopsis sp. NPDC006938]|uniref:helix-turn-helix domain-containing protein n=1 Tax=Nocardiopsis sp. NPDC006938 TaxID=3364337 RepID=UPI003674FEE1
MIGDFAPVLSEEDLMSDTVQIPVRRRYLISRLKQLRTAAALTHLDVATEMGWDRGKLNRLEQGNFKRLNAADVIALATLYKASEEETAALAQMARDSKKVSWWYRYSEQFPGPYIALEAEAVRIEELGTQLIPGLFQTAEYTTALMERSLDVTVPRDELQPRLQVRAERQRSILDRPEPPHIWVVLDEAVLRRKVGGPEVMRQQILHLLDLAQRPTIDIQVLPFESGAHAASGFQFVLLRFEGSNAVAYIETDQDGLYVEEPEKFKRYTLVFDRLQAAALSVEDSYGFMEALTAQP